MLPSISDIISLISRLYHVWEGVVNAISRTTTRTSPLITSRQHWRTVISPAHDARDSPNFPEYMLRRSGDRVALSGRLRSHLYVRLCQGSLL